MIGHQSENDIYASPISKSFITAHKMRDLALTHAEKLQLLNLLVFTMWILLLRGCYPNKHII